MSRASRKDIARDFLSTIVGGQIDEAFEKYVGSNAKHHNLFTPPGRQALKQGMKDNDDQFPDKKLNIKHLVAEGDIVITHSQLVMKPGDAGLVVVHVLKFDGYKIVELWDCAQPIPDDSLNTDGAF